MRRIDPKAADLCAPHRRWHPARPHVWRAGHRRAHRRSRRRTLGDILRGTVPGRTTDTETTIYAPVELPWQDLALAWTANQSARESGTGRDFDFLTW